MTDESKELIFEITSIDKSTRTIRGVAHVETVDKDQETILIKAIEDALPDFMALPILTVDHMERPVGLITKAQIEGLSLEVEAKIKETRDCDDVWLRVEKGQTTPTAPDALNSFSIKGIRKAFSKECLIPQGQRSSPCVTKAIHLWAITLCGGNARNPLAYFDVVKSFAPELVETIAPPGSVLKPGPETPVKPVCPRKTMPDNPATPGQEPAANAVTPPAASPDSVTKAEPSAAPVVDVGSLITKAFAEQMPEITKATVTAVVDLQKAQDLKIDQKLTDLTQTVTKATAPIADLTARLEKLEAGKTRLGPTAVIDKAGKTYEIGSIDDPRMANLMMIQKAASQRTD